MRFLFSLPNSCVWVEYSWELIIFASICRCVSYMWDLCLSRSPSLCVSFVCLFFLSLDSSECTQKDMIFVLVQWLCCLPHSWKWQTVFVIFAEFEFWIETVAAAAAVSGDDDNNTEEKIKCHDTRAFVRRTGSSSQQISHFSNVWKCQTFNTLRSLSHFAIPVPLSCCFSPKATIKHIRANILGNEP